MDGPHAPTSHDPEVKDTEDRDRRVSACLREYHVRRAAGEAVEAEEFAARLAPEEFDFFDTLVDMDGLLEDPEPTVNNAALPRTFGDYTLLREAGNGATGVVYEAVEHGLRRSVAVKVLRASFGSDDVVRERFLRESDACSQIDHPNVVTVFHSGEAEGHPYYSMTYVDGLPLSKMLGSNDLDVRDVCRHAAEVADALGQIHKAGIIHRDVKPSNIMQAPDGRWILTDFGHVHNDAAMTLTKSGDALGTPMYMSPEQARGIREIDGRSDIYSLGASLYHLITGTPVFAADDLQGLMRAVLMDRAESMARRMMDVPQDLDRVVLKCLEKRPEDRYQSMEELAVDLRAVAEGRSAAGRPVTKLQRAMRWIPQHPMRAAAAALIAIGFTWALWPAPPAPIITPTLTIATMDGAMIAVTGHPDQRAPLSGPVPLEVGEYSFEVSLERFRTHTERHVAKSGVEYHHSFVLLPVDPDDVVAQTILQSHLGHLPADAPTLMARSELLSDRAGLTRASSPLRTALVYPRGKITVDELDQYLFSAGEENAYDDDETIHLVWFRNNEELRRDEFDPKRNVERHAIPTEVREAFQPGDTLRWAIMQGKQAIASAEAQVVEAGLDDLPEAVIRQLAQLEKIGMSPDELRAMKVRIWGHRGFLTKALREVQGGDTKASFMLASNQVRLLRELFQADDAAFRDNQEQLEGSEIYSNAMTGAKARLAQKTEERMAREQADAEREQK